MFFNEPNSAYKLKGVFFVSRSSLEGSVFKKRNYSSIAYRISGNSTFYFENQHLDVGAGSVVFIPEGVSFSRRSTAEDLLVLHLNCYGQADKFIQVVHNAQKTEPLFRKLLSIWEAKDTQYYNQSIQLLYGIFNTLSNISQQQPIPEVIRPGVELLQNSFKDPTLRIEHLAQACFISEVYFRKLYYRHFGVTPQQAITKLRFQYARELLSSGYYTQKEVAKMAGFSDVKYFRTAFKKHFGTTITAQKAGIL